VLRSRVRELEGIEGKAAEKAKELDALLAWQVEAKKKIEELSQVC